jgi:hypothetical protein
MQAFLQTDPIYAKKFKNGWLWTEKNTLKKQQKTMSYETKTRML